MSELDDLRRVAYGRTSTPEEEAAAAVARAELEARERPVEAPAVDEPEVAEPETAEMIDESNDEPGQLRRLATTWRAWAAPALAGFVVGIVLTAACGAALFSERQAAAPENTTAPSPGIEEAQGTLAIESGNLAAATAVLARPQEAKDTLAALDGSIDPASTRMLRAFSAYTVYAATSIHDEICLLMIDESPNTVVTCAPASRFSIGGLALGRMEGDENVRVHWDGTVPVETRTLR